MAVIQKLLVMLKGKICAVLLIQFVLIQCHQKKTGILKEIRSDKYFKTRIPKVIILFWKSAFAK